MNNRSGTAIRVYCKCNFLQPGPTWRCMPLLSPLLSPLVCVLLDTAVRNRSKDLEGSCPSYSVDSERHLTSNADTSACA
jgi:hypothetical protein